MLCPTFPLSSLCSCFSSRDQMLKMCCPFGMAVTSSLALVPEMRASLQVERGFFLQLESWSCLGSHRDGQPFTTAASPALRQCDIGTRASCGLGGADLMPTPRVSVLGCISKHVLDLYQGQSKRFQIAACPTAMVLSSSGSCQLSICS